MSVQIDEFRERGYARVKTIKAAQTEALGARLASSLKAGDVVLVAGEVGAGKTTLIRGACRALGVTVPVTSPTFTIGQRYDAAIPVSHLDLFRLGPLAAEEPELLADYLGPHTISFVEWPPDETSELVTLGQLAYRIRIEHASDSERFVEIT